MSNWQDAPDWAIYRAIDAFSGDVHYFQWQPTGPGWVNVEQRIHPGESYCGEWVEVRPDTIKELSDMCFGSEQVDHAAEPTPDQLRKELAEREQIPVVYDRPIITNGPIHCSDGPTRDRIAAELAEALECWIKTHPDDNWLIRESSRRLANYKQSRGG